MASSAAAETDERRRVEREGGAGPEHLDEHAAQRRAREAQRDRPHELVQRIGLGEVVGGQHLGHERVEGRAEEGRARAVDGRERGDVPQLEGAGEREQRQEPDGEPADDVGGDHDRAGGRGGR